MIKRYFNSEEFDRIKKDFTFLISMINNSFGEYDFSIREKYFNIYYKGNSLAKITFNKDNEYTVEINSKFFENTKAHSSNYYNSCSKTNGNYKIKVSSTNLHQFLQRKHLNEISSMIKKVNHGEEIGFEQALITDNHDKENIIFIDRQITDSGLKQKRLDLLALKQVEGNKYTFLVSEVKLGNNKELKSDVVDQLNGYLKHIKANFKSYKECYEIQYQQKKELGLFNIPNFKDIEIIEPVEGIIIVGGYSGLAKSQIEELKKNNPDIRIKHFTYEI